MSIMVHPEPTVPGMRLYLVLMIGAGSGGDVYGATLAGCNVVAVENDVAQFTDIQRAPINRAQMEQDEVD